MDEKNLPRVMALSLSTWRSDSGIHTQTDLFKFWDKDKVAQIYLKSDLPKTPVCDKFFQISENAIIHSVINRKKVGSVVYNDAEGDKKAILAERKLYAKAHRRKSWFMTCVREIVWILGRWKTDNLKEFLECFDAEVYFVPIYPLIYTARIQEYVLKKCPRPYVCYLADDNYSYMTCGKNIFAYIHRFFLRKHVKRLAENCDEMFTITELEAKDTDSLFGTHSIVLTKGINYDGRVFHATIPKEKIRMVYTGNLLIGRATSLVAISKALEKINKNELLVTLDIYSPTVLDDNTMRLLNSNGCNFKGSVEKSKIEQIQSEADVVVFVESLEKKHRMDARLSFSTKLTDYFASGKCIFAIGDENIAPIKYLKDNDAALISTNYKDVEKNILKLVDNKELITEFGRKAFDCGKRNHEEKKIKETFISTLVKATVK